MTIQGELSPTLDAMPSAGARAPITEGDLASLFGRAAEAHAALMAGEVATYFDMVAPVADLLLMTPVGGFTQRSGPCSPEEVADLKGFFRGGTGTAELLAAHGSGDLAVLVMIERARARIAEFPEQDWALRVTLVFRREGGRWRLVHRHADPLAGRIGWERVAELARA